MTLNVTQADRYRRLAQRMELLEKASAGLSRSRRRLFEQQTVDAHWVRFVGARPEREDIMESFVS